jgi:hypothetical protein
VEEERLGRKWETAPAGYYSKKGKGGFYAKKIMVRRPHLLIEHRLVLKSEGARELSED